MSDYTPSDAEIRDAYVYIDKGRRVLARAEFTRWLEAHDREVAAKELDDFAADVRGDWATYACPWVGAIDDRAAAVRRGRS